MNINTTLPIFLDNIAIILCHTSHPGNLGSVARAMKNMGLHHLILVSPNIMVTPATPIAPIFNANEPTKFSIPEESFVLASGAKDVLEEAQIYSSLKDALSNFHLACALTSRRREITLTPQTPRELTPEIISLAKEGKKIALVFGSETFGLSIEEVTLCNRLITIPGNPNYLSLNLAQAVQVISYELFSQLNYELSHLKTNENLASRSEVQGLVDHFELIMEQQGFFERRNKTRLLRRLQRFIDKAQVEKEEIDILRGFLSSLNKP